MKNIDLSKARISLDTVLLSNRISSITDYRMVEVDSVLYYQINQNNRLTYINVSTGLIDKFAELRYAKQIAQEFLGDSTAKATSAELVKEFDEEYLPINRLLPIYKVSFDRKDGIRLYVDVTTDRLGLAMDNNRAAFHSFFRNFHSWEFLERTGNFRLLLIVFISSLSFLTAAMGIYIAFITKSKKASSFQGSTLKYRRLHRRIAIVVSITTLMFTFSGAYHAFVKIEPGNRSQYFIKNDYVPDELKFNLDSIAKRYQVKNISLVKMKDTTYLRLTCSVSKGIAKDDCCEKMSVAASKFGIEKKLPKPLVHYLSIPDLKELPNGDEQYARFMAEKFSANSNIETVSMVTEFKGEYGFINKRLPVYKVQYKEHNNERWYVEPSTGELSVRIDDTDLREGLSFAMLHKFHFADKFGKTTRDVLTVIAALGNLVAALAGVILLVFWYKKKKKRLVRA